MTAETSLGLFPRPTKSSVRAAVAKCIRDVKAHHDLSNRKLADRIGCCDATIANAENEEATLDLVTICAIGHEFGQAALAPIMAATFGITAPERSEADIIEEIHRLVDMVGRVSLRAVA